MFQIVLAATLCLAQASFYAHAPAPIQLSPDGKNVLDTPEVAHAKAAHLAAHAQASSVHGAWAPAGGAYYGGAGYGAGAHYGAGGHYGAPAAGKTTTSLLSVYFTNNVLADVPHTQACTEHGLTLLVLPILAS